MKSTTLGKLLMVLGGVLLAAAALLTTYNLQTERKAGREAERIMEAIRTQYGEQLHLELITPPEETSEPGVESTTVAKPGSTEETSPAETEGGETAPVEETQPPLPTHDIRPEPVVIPDYVMDPNMDMPTIAVEAIEYLGVLDLPTLGLSLPIISDWNMDLLNITPCWYDGSVYTEDLILLGHNYRRHFGGLSRLDIGDKVNFIDGAGNIFHYTVAEIVTVDGSDGAGMREGDWPLTMFTCTLSGNTRLVVRCEMTKEEVMEYKYYK